VDIEGACLKSWYVGACWSRLMALKQLLLMSAFMAMALLTG
jgi:hypothetical protein